MTNDEEREKKTNNEYFVPIVDIIGNVAMLVEDLSTDKMQKPLQRTI